MWLLILFWLLFGISHSLLAATKVRAFFEAFTPNKPLYFGLLLLGLTIFLSHPTVRTFISLAFSQFYVVIGIEFEERKLRRVFGQAYLDYAKGKKKFIPFIY